MTKEPTHPASPGTAVAHSTGPGTNLETAALGDAFEQFAGSGLEKTSVRDTLIPRLGIIQALSDQRKRTSSNFIDGAEEGDICDIGTNEIMPKPVHILPVLWDKVWIEWYPRNSNRGIAAIHPTDEIMQQTRPDKDNRPTLPNGNYVAETAQWYLLNLSAGRRPSYLPMASSQLKYSRRWVALAQGERLTNSAGREYVPPLFYRSYLLDTQLETKNNNQWYSWKIARDKAIHELAPNWADTVLCDAIRFRDAVLRGVLEADRSNMTDDATVIDATFERKSSARPEDDYNKRFPHDAEQPL